MAHKIFAGNLKLVLCFVFYLAWWIIGFNPKHPIRGLQSGWLLICAAILGALALADIWGGLDLTGGLVPGVAVVAGGAIAYVALLGITGGLLHRPVTSELLIIVLWTTISLLEVGTLVGVAHVTAELGWALSALCLLCAAGSLVCYQLFYKLDAGAAFVDGAIPLILACAMTGLLAFCATW